MLFDKFFCDDDFFDAFFGGDIVHHGEHKLLHDGAKSACADIARNSKLGDGLTSAVRKLQLNAVQREQFGILLDDRILRLAQDADERRFVEIVQRRDDRQSAHQLGNQTVFDDVMRIDVAVNACRRLFFLRLDLAAEADRLAAARPRPKRRA